MYSVTSVEKYSPVPTLASSPLFFGQSIDLDPKNHPFWAPQWLAPCAPQPAIYFTGCRRSIVAGHHRTIHGAIIAWAITHLERWMHQVTWKKKTGYGYCLDQKGEKNCLVSLVHMHTSLYFLQLNLQIVVLSTHRSIGVPSHKPFQARWGHSSGWPSLVSRVACPWQSWCRWWNQCYLDSGFFTTCCGTIIPFCDVSLPRPHYSIVVVNGGCTVIQPQTNKRHRKLGKQPSYVTVRPGEGLKDVGFHHQILPHGNLRPAGSAFFGGKKKTFHISRT